MNQNTVTLTLTVEDANYILLALQELPAKICNPLSQKIHEQARDQVTPEPAAE
jgi:hypothetical protein